MSRRSAEYGDYLRAWAVRARAMDTPLLSNLVEGFENNAPLDAAAAGMRDALIEEMGHRRERQP